MDTRLTASLLGVIALALCVGLFAAHTQSSAIGAPAATAVPTPFPPVSPNEVHIVVNTSGNPPANYDPPSLSVHVGSAVTWTNLTQIDHTVTADTSSTLNSPILAAGQHFVWRATRPGTYSYSCLFHPELHGAVVVLP